MITSESSSNWRPMSERPDRVGYVWLYYRNIPTIEIGNVTCIFEDGTVNVRRALHWILPGYTEWRDLDADAWQPCIEPELPTREQA